VNPKLSASESPFWLCIESGTQWTTGKLAALFYLSGAVGSNVLGYFLAQILIIVGTRKLDSGYSFAMQTDYKSTNDFSF